MLVLCAFLRFAYFFEIMFVFNQCTVILLGTCLTYCFRVTVSAVIVDVVVGRLTYDGTPHRTCQLAPLSCTVREALNLAVWPISDWRQRWIT